MAKRKSNKPQGTFTSEEVTELFLRLWALGDALETGDINKAQDLHLHVFGAIPDTTTNTGARTRARHMRQKANAAKKEAEQEAKVNGMRRFEDLTVERKQAALSKLRKIIADMTLEKNASKHNDDQDDLNQLRAMWGDE